MALKPHRAWLIVWAVVLDNGNAVEQGGHLVTDDDIHSAIRQLEEHGKEVAPDVTGILIRKIDMMAPMLLLDDGEEPMALVH